MVWPLLLPVLGWGSAATGLTAAGLGITHAIDRIPRSRRKSYLNDSSLFRDGSFEGDVGILDGLIGINPEDLKTEKIASIKHERDNDPGVIARSQIPGIRKPRLNETAKNYNASTQVKYDQHNKKEDPSYVLLKDQVSSATKAQESETRLREKELADLAINRQEDRFHSLQMLQAQQQQSNNQWAREMAYYDRKDEARREEKELETLIAGLTALGANLFV